MVIVFVNFAFTIILYVTSHGLCSQVIPFNAGISQHMALLSMHYPALAGLPESLGT